MAGRLIDCVPWRPYSIVTEGNPASVLVPHWPGPMRDVAVAVTRVINKMMEK